MLRRVAPPARPPVTPVELQRRLQAEARGEPFLLHRHAEGAERIVALVGRTTVGRGPAADLQLGDEEVSRLHAQLEPIGEAWVLADDGLSRNGSYVNGERVEGRRRLRDGDTLRFGDSEVLFRAPGEDVSGETRPARDVPAAASLSDAQRRVLVALCRPFKEVQPYARPATNREVAAEVFLSVDAVKGHLRVLFDKLGVGDFPQNEKRLRLVERAFDAGLVTRREL